MAISGLTKALKDIMRMDEGINGDAQYIGQIAWLLFLKAFDYKEQEWELLEDDYKTGQQMMKVLQVMSF